MSLRVNNTEITKVVFNGVEQKALKYNNVGYFGKSYTLTQNSSNGAVLTIRRTSSPNQRASTGYISAGQTIYYGDELTISVAAAVNYTNPKLYVDTGSGMSLRSKSYSFTVTDNVVFYGTATEASAGQWRTLWLGPQTFTDPGDITIPNLAGCSQVEVTANAVFNDNYIDLSTEEWYEGNQYTDSCTESSLPVTLRGCNASITISKNGNLLEFAFNDGWEESKGFCLYEQPISLTITEVKGR